jgi:hypothetical protein
MAGLYSCSAGPWFNHGIEEVAGFFAAGNLRLMRGEAGDVRCWPLLTSCERDGAILGGIGMKP